MYTMYTTFEAKQIDHYGQIKHVLYGEIAILGPKKLL